MHENIDAKFLPKGELIGRKDELRYLKSLLHHRGESNFVYYYASGGFGKTRLLEELQTIVRGLGETFRTTGIIDLYHTDTHSASDVERAIVEGLDPDGKYFGEYRTKRHAYEELRERGADPSILERRREELSEAFVRDWDKPALEFKKLVICFDTIELLQYESSVVEDTVGSYTVDTRVRAWLLDKLPRLANVLVVFAGRPKQRSGDETVNHQERLLAEMLLAFGSRFEPRPLPPLDLTETEELISKLTQQIMRRIEQGVPQSSDSHEKVPEIVPAKYLPVIYQLTAGRPIYVHLIIDLLGGLAQEPRVILEMLDPYLDLASAKDDDGRIEEARHNIEAQILETVYNRADEGYISSIALMPKGVDAEILSSSLGPTLEEAQSILEQLAPLSFVKQYSALRGVQMLHGERLFLHDEMYQLLTPIKFRRMHERHVAQGLIESYYDPQIAELHQQLQHLVQDADDKDAPAKRVLVRERLQKLRVERLYYQMVRDPHRAYQEYKDLSDEANRNRWVGFAMRLLDEFLRFYNVPERRAQFKEFGISHEQVIRESTELWVERFYWWGQKQRCIALAEMVMSDPAKFRIHADDAAILGNICARWVDAKADLHGYDPDVVARAEAFLVRLGNDPSTPEAKAAVARLHTNIGYQLRKGGQLKRAAEHYVKGNTAYRKLGRHKDELAMLLNNLAYAYAVQGRFHLARPLASEALRINETLGNDYTTGLTLSTFAAIEVLRGNFDDAIRYGKGAHERFQRMQDPHGIVLAYRSLARAERRMAKESIDRGRLLDDAYERLDTARDYLIRALDEVTRSGLDDDRGSVYAEWGRVMREMGKLTAQTGRAQEAEDYYHESEHHLNAALQAGPPRVEEADILQDLGELQAVQGAYLNAQDSLQRVEQTVGPAHSIGPGVASLPDERLPSEYFLPLGKAERLRGKIGFKQAKYEEALQHFVVAYAYFERFSSETPEKTQMIELVYDNLTRLDLDIEAQRELVMRTREWAAAQPFAADVRGFTDTLRDLTGM